MDTQTIEWRKSDIDSALEISNTGLVRVARTGRLLSIKPHKEGYLIVARWRKDGERWKKVKIHVHKLVTDAFIGHRPENLLVRHLDCDKTNNAASNLAYGSAQDNHFDSVKAGHVLCKLTPEKVKDIRKTLSFGLSVARTARKFGVTWDTIKKIRDRKLWAWVE